MTTSASAMIAPLITLTIANLLAVGLLAWLRSRRSGDGPAAEAGERVACRECGADNDAGYRYCRRCLTELPGPAPYASPASGTGSPNPF